VSYQQLKNENGIADMYNRIGNMFYRMEKFPKALEAYQQSISAYQKTTNQTAMAQVWSNIGHTYKQQKQYSQAVEAHRKALALYQKIKNLSAQVDTFNAIGYVYLNQNRNERNHLQAIKLAEQGLKEFQQALEITRKIPDRRLEAFTLQAIGQALDAQKRNMYEEGKYEKSLDFALQSLKYSEHALLIYKDLNKSDGIKVLLDYMASQYIALAVNYSDLDKDELFLAAARKAQELYRQVGDDKGIKLAISLEMSAYSSMSRSYKDTSENYAKKLELNQKAIELARQIFDYQSEITALNANGQTYGNLGQYPKAIELFQQAIKRAAEIRNPKLAIPTWNYLGQIYEYQGKYDQALNTYYQSLKLSRVHYNLTGETQSLQGIASVHHARGQFKDATSHYQQALQISQKRYELYSQGVTLETFRAFCLEQKKSSTYELRW
jgi:tetratricopeptide (TPR) repeat protein